MRSTVNDIKKNNSEHHPLICFDCDVTNLGTNISKFEINDIVASGHGDNNMKHGSTQMAIHKKTMLHTKQNQNTVSELKNMFDTLNKNENVLREKIHMTCTELEALNKDFANIMDMYSRIVKTVT